MPVSPVAASYVVFSAISLDAASYKRVPHKNKFGKDYGREVY